MPATSDDRSNLLGPLQGVKEKGHEVVHPAALLAIGLFVGIIGFSACAGPSFRPETPTGIGGITQEIPGLWVSVEAEAWHGRPRTLPDYVLPFLLQLKNTGATPLTITRADFLLLDEAHRQYSPIPPAEIVSMLGGRGSGIGISPSVGVSGSTAGSTSFGVGLDILLGGSGPDTRDIIPPALAEGSIQPGAEVRGFLYFPRPAPEIRNLRLIVIPQDLPGRLRLDFQFRRSSE
jgi:hypothetical protein